MKNKIMLLIILVCTILSGCSKVDKKQEISREAAARKVINAMSTGPNEDLCNESAFSMIGEGVDLPLEKGEDWKELKQNWQTLVGEYFAIDALDTFLEYGPAIQFLSEAYFKGTIMSVEKIEIVQKEAQTEVYLIHWIIGEEKRQDKIFFRYNSENLIEEVKIL